MRGGRCERSALGLTGMQAAGARWGGLGGGGAVLVPCQACARAVLCVSCGADGDGRRWHLNSCQTAWRPGPTP